MLIKVQDQKESRFSDQSVIKMWLMKLRRKLFPQKQDYIAYNWFSEFRPMSIFCFCTIVGQPNFLLSHTIYLEGKAKDIHYLS